MQTHLQHAGVQEQGCGALWSLAGNDANQVKIGEAGGVDAVVKAMQTHLQHAGVQEQGCGALMNLAAKDALRASIKDLGGCTAARSASEAHGLSLARELAEMLA